MPVSELGSAFVMPFEPRRRAPDRRASRDSQSLRPPLEAAAPAPEAAFAAPVVVPDLSHLTTLDGAPPAAPAGVDLYAHLNLLAAAIREGDLARARSLVETLEIEMLVERSAGRAPPARPRVEAAPGQAVDSVYETLAHYLVTDGLTS